MAVRRNWRHVEAEVDALAAEWRRMCTCVPEPVAFSSDEECIAAMVGRCPNHGGVFDPEEALVFKRGEWRPVCAPYGFPALLSASESPEGGGLEFDDPADFVDAEAEKVRAGRAAYDALLVAERPTPASYTRKFFDFLFHYGQIAADHISAPERAERL